MANFAENSDAIRSSALESGIANLKSRIKDVDYDLQTEANCDKKKKVAPKYTKEETADRMVSIYKENVKLPTHEPNDPKKEQVKANTVASRANIRALSNSLANIRNTGTAGPTTEFTPSANGDVNPGRPRGYNALVVAGTEMTLEDYEAYVASKFGIEELEEKKGLWDNIHAKRKRGESAAKPGEKGYPKTLDIDEGLKQARKNVGASTCWDGYKAQGTKTKGGKEVPNCVKEATYPSDFKDGSPVAKSKRDRNNMRPKQDDCERDAAGRRKCVDESVVSELKDKLLELNDVSWQSIDRVMRVLAKENNITPKELHKEFKSQNDGQIPDEWIKENRIKEDCGYVPLDEVAILNRVGNVYDVTLMWRAHTRRLKFFYPEVGQPSQEDMQKQVEKFYPGGKLLAFYMSTEPGDNQTNSIVVIPPLSDSYNWWDADDWQLMTEETTAVYDMICEEEGEPVGPPILNEEGQYELMIVDHETGVEKLVVFEDDMKGMSVSSGDKRSTESGAGLTAKGVAKYRAKNPGSKLKTAVTTPPSKLKPGSKAAGRRKSFCARSRGWNGERGKAARRRWNC